MSEQQPEDVTCAYCDPEAVNESVDGDLTSWKSTEFGWQCIECQISNPDAPGSSTAGMAGVVAVLADEEKAE